MRILLSVLLLLMFLPSYSGEARLALWPARIELTVTPVALDWRKPDRTRLGRLIFLGGVQLRSKVEGFGGFSALTVTGDRFFLLSDGGNYVRFRMGRDWRVRAVTSGALAVGPASGWRKEDRDSESVTIDRATGTAWVGFESSNQIWRYDPAFARGRGVAPPAMARWPRSGGPEAMVRLRDGSFLVFAETARAKTPGTREALWFAGDPIAAPNRGFRFSYRTTRGYAPTDAAELPDGRIVLINRRASLSDGFTGAVTVVDRAAIRPGAVIEGREIARLAAPVLHDNFEGVAVVQEGRDTILWILSDDNQLFLQRTLLLKFKLN